MIRELVKINSKGKKEELVSGAVHRVFRENKMAMSIDDRYPPMLRATIATYLFNMSPSVFYSRKIGLKIHEEKHQQKSYVIFELNGVERLCPLLNDDEIAMALALFNPDIVSGDELSFMPSDLKKGSSKFGASLPKLYKQVHNDAVEIFKRLNIPLINPHDQKMCIKALRDLRIANCVINQGIDYGFLSLYGLGRSKYRFFANNMFKQEIEDYFIEELGRRSAQAYEMSAYNPAH